MANYQREFLVPYLRDVSALHLALHKLEQRLETLHQQKDALDTEIRSVDMPRNPRYEAANGVFLIGCGIYGFLLSIMMFTNQAIWPGCLCILCGIMGCSLGTLRYVLVSRENARKEECYNQNYSEYLELQRRNKQQKDNLSAISKEIHECRRELAHLKGTLAKVYAANLIPKQYWTTDAALFLYVWFATDRPNDLDMALNVFVHEDILKRMDRIITNQAESFLKPYLPSAKQKLEASTATLRSKLEQMDIPDNERNTYLSIIECNIATVAYFSTAKYLAQL